ncbi:D-alanyl-D-alanine carboxypeptidase [Cyclobacterium jeungdonense]|uniref:D-alanyl-D-alanine carboxypeptidase n=1 Tax=Cyclobacterium jeungdonense TaxID=708087 RepID=A0ABT8C5V6_9BACT|nr:D-alanyl-D-alanine carboxypeptidase [Cyclobacterium jeungdonense]MDN3687447.1 D-alanyl-D-alanine carboxypeptidase [Cyclobacterium jeungdonense]
MKHIYWLLLLLFCNCTVQKVKKSVYDSEVFEKGHMGFMLYDPVKEKTLVSMNEKKYFIPASNTKIFTFYSSYKVLGDDRVNGLNYIEKGDSLLFWGTGDPSLLHPDLQDSTVIHFLQKRPEDLYMVDNFDQISRYGRGWTWNWYPYYFAAERSSMPVYGNVLRYSKEADAPVAKAYPYTALLPLSKQIDNTPDSYVIRRDFESNIFSYALNPEAGELSFETDKPFITSANLTKNLLQEAVGREITLIDDLGYSNLTHQKLPTAKVDSIYAQMMKISDNFLAEQLMVLVSDELFDSLDLSAAIQYAKDSLLQDLPDEPQWVDGSGLSPQNMFTPRSVVRLLEKIKEEVPMEKIKAYFPAGGESGTIRNWYPADPGEPAYIYAKTGTLSMSSALSGYLITKSGKTLIFSTFFNNYTGSSNVQKEELQKVLYFIHSNY